MKKTLFFIITVTFSSILFSQESPKKWEEMKAKKIAFISEYVDFTPEEAQLFWPLYNEFDKKAASVRHRREEIKANFPKKPTPSDYEKANDISIRLREEMTSLRVEYYDKFKKILSPEKLYKYYQAESEYKKSLLKSLEAK